jgi:hypothetical protein
MFLPLEKRELSQLLPLQGEGWRGDGVVIPFDLDQGNSLVYQLSLE